MMENAKYSFSQSHFTVIQKANVFIGAYLMCVPLVLMCAPLVLMCVPLVLMCVPLVLMCVPLVLVCVPLVIIKPLSNFSSCFMTLN